MIMMRPVAIQQDKTIPFPYPNMPTKTNSQRSFHLTSPSHQLGFADNRQKMMDPLLHKKQKAFTNQRPNHPNENKTDQKSKAEFILMKRILSTRDNLPPQQANTYWYFKANQKSVLPSRQRRGGWKEMKADVYRKKKKLLIQEQKDWWA